MPERGGAANGGAMLADGGTAWHTTELLFRIMEQAVRVATQYASAPASLAIISCKYENRQRLQSTTEFVKT